MPFLLPRKGASLLLAAILALAPSPLANADCECGYRITVPSTVTDSSPTNLDPAAPQQYVVTDLLETNFANISDVSQNDAWVRQAFNVTAQQAQSTYGQMTAVDNVMSVAGTGLELTLRGMDQVVDGMVQGAEIDTARRDMFYGTFRSSMRLTDVSGTVSAFFYYFNDTQEMDVEFLSREFDGASTTYPVHLVLQSRAAAVVSDASQTPTYATVNLPFDPSAGFHEYRFDFVPGRVIFYADGAVLVEMDDPAGIPTVAGHLAFNHWSNGNGLWSGGPPAVDAVMRVRYVKAYFNSSDAGRQADFEKRCGDAAAPGAVCDVPDVTAGNDSAADFFFSGQQNMTAGQTISPDSGIDGADQNGGAMSGGDIGWYVMGLATAVTGLVLGF